MILKGADFCIFLCVLETVSVVETAVFPSWHPTFCRSAGHLHNKPQLVFLPKPHAREMMIYVI